LRFLTHVYYVTAIDMLPKRVPFSPLIPGNVLIFTFTNEHDDPISMFGFIAHIYRVVFSSRFAIVYHFQMEVDIILR